MEASVAYRPREAGSKRISASTSRRSLASSESIANREVPALRMAPFLHGARPALAK